MDKPREAWLKMHTASIDDKRNALGSFESGSLESAAQAIEEALKIKGFNYHSYTERVGQYRNFRIELNDCMLVQEVKLLQRQNVSHYPIGIYLEEIFPNQYMVWIYRTIRKKAITSFRHFLFKEIFYHK